MSELDKRLFLKNHRWRLTADRIIEIHDCAFISFGNMTHETEHFSIPLSLLAADLMKTENL